LSSLRRIARRAGALGTVLALLMAPGPSDAQTRATRSTAPKAPRSATAAPSRIVDVPLPPAPVAAAPAAPAAAAPAAPAAAAPRTTWLGVSAGPFAAFDRGSGFAVAIDYSRTATPARWRRAELELHVPVTLSRPSSTEDLTRTFTLFGETISDTFGRRELTATLVEIVPTARVRLPLGPARTFALFADGGLGLAFGMIDEVEDERFRGHTETLDAAMALALRIGAGFSYDATPRLRVLFQPVALTLHAGTDWSSYTALAGLSYRL
jgi:hypothetical protein